MVDDGYSSLASPRKLFKAFIDFSVPGSVSPIILFLSGQHPGEDRQHNSSVYELSRGVVILCMARN